jgi:hypothetical protein
VAELTARVDLCDPAGRLNPAAVGWTRRPLHTANLRGWGRTKRWEYWGVMTPQAFVGVTVSSLDYAGVHGIYVLDRRSGTETVRGTVEPLARSTVLPPRSGVGTARASAGGLAIELASTAAGTHLDARAEGVHLVADVGPGAESLGVVVPWSTDRFQYTVKDVGRPVSGTLHLGGEQLAFGPADGSFAVLDHGRGRWPYDITWNWAAGFGVLGGRRIGLQLGGRWTDGTGQTENALFLDGRLHKVHDDLLWTYDRDDWTAPWRIRGPGVDVTLAPFHERIERTNLVVVASQIHQCFGRFTGWVHDETRTPVAVDGLVGWAEEAHNRW